MDRLERAVRKFDNRPGSRRILEDIAEIRKEASFASVPRTTAGGGRGRSLRSNYRMIASVPNDVMAAIQILYREEMKDPKFWKWFLKKYPQFRVQE